MKNYAVLAAITILLSHGYALAPATIRTMLMN
jgi:hypothetical protein